MSKKILKEHTKVKKGEGCLLKENKNLFSRFSFIMSCICAAGVLFGCENASDIKGNIQDSQRENIQENMQGDLVRESSSVENEDNLPGETQEDLKESWDMPPMVRIDGVLYYSTNELIDPPENPHIDGEILTEVDSSEIPAAHNESNFGTGFPYQFGLNKGELNINIHGNWEIFRCKYLTLDRILSLSKKEDLSWDDFDGYYSEDIGSGLMILRYDIQDDVYDNLYLLIGGTPGDIPMYFYLSSQNTERYIDIRTEDIEKFLDEIEKIKEKHVVVGIVAHIKEIRGDSMLVSSDTDEFPGAYLVTGIQTFSMEDELQGGDSVYLLMEDLRQKSTEGIPLYRAEGIMILSEGEKRVQPDILLTDAPEFCLEDLLSSTYCSTAVRSENYQWTVTENGEAQTITACGAGPLEEAAMETSVKLTIPKYQGLDKVSYCFSMQVAPDILTVRQWDASDIGNTEAEEERITTYYSPLSILDLEKGKIYEFTAEWKEENQDIHTFYGVASYVLLTE